MLYRYKNLVLNTRTRQLFRDEIPIPINQRTLEVLIFLVEKNGQVALRDEIIAAVWPHSIVSETNLYTQISALRLSLSGEAVPDNLIRTVPGVGYRIDRWEMISETDQSGESIIPHPTPDPPPRADSGKPLRWCRRIIVSIPVLIGVLVVVLFLAIIFESKWMPLGPSEIIDLRPKSGFKKSLSTSPDGRFIVYLESSSSGASPLQEQSEYESLFIQQIESGEVTELTSRRHRRNLDVVWGPDAGHITLISRPEIQSDRNELIAVDLTDQSEKTIGEVREGGLDWHSGLGSFVVCDGSDGESSRQLWLINRSGRTRRQLTTSTSNQMVDSLPRFSPDGKMVAFVRRQNEWTGDLHVIDTAGGTPRRVTFDQQKIVDLEWTPDSREILFVSNRTGGQRLWQVSLNSKSSPRPVHSVTGEVQNFTLNPAGNEIAYIAPANDTVIEINPLPSSGIRALIKLNSPSIPCRIDATGYDHSPVFSPNNRMIAFVSNQSGNEEVWVADVDCRNPRQISLFGHSRLGVPVWAPDGASLAVEVMIDGQSDIFEIPVEGRQPRRLTSSPFNERFPVWSGDGQWILYTSFQEQPQIWKLSVNGVEIFPVISNQWGRFAIAADSATLFSSENGTFRRSSLPEGVVTLLPQWLDEDERKGCSEYWDLVGDEIFTASNRARTEVAILRFTPSNGRVTQVASYNSRLSSTVPGLTVSHDRRLVAFTAVLTGTQDIRLLRGWRQAASNSD